MSINLHINLYFDCGLYKNSTNIHFVCIKSSEILWTLDRARSTFLVQANSLDILGKSQWTRRKWKVFPQHRSVCCQFNSTLYSSCLFWKFCANEGMLKTVIYLLATSLHTPKKCGTNVTANRKVFRNSALYLFIDSDFILTFGVCFFESIRRSVLSKHWRKCTARFTGRLVIPITYSVWAKHL